MSAGTLRLVEDEIGLRMEIDLANTTAGRDTAEDVRAGNLSGCSFSFTVEVDEWDWSGLTTIRTLRKIDTLFDTGPVGFPRV